MDCIFIIIMVLIIGLVIYRHVRKKRDSKNLAADLIYDMFALNEEAIIKIAHIKDKYYVEIAKISMDSIKRAIEVSKSFENLQAEKLAQISYGLAKHEMNRKGLELNEERELILHVLIHSYIFSLDYNQYRVERRCRIRTQEKE